MSFKNKFHCSAKLSRQHQLRWRHYREQRAQRPRQDKEWRCQRKTTCNKNSFVLISVSYINGTAAYFPASRLLLQLYLESGQSVSADTPRLPWDQSPPQTHFATPPCAHRSAESQRPSRRLNLEF